MPTPRIFISYSHDSEAHRNFVLGLANKLRQDGLDCQIDQYVNGFPAEGWQRWMETQIEDADFVLVVCTPVYLKRYRGRGTDGGRGVNFEGVVISQSLYDVYYRNTKFVPVLLEGGDIEDVPLPLKGFGAFRVMAEYEGLYRYLTGQARVVAPEVGELKVKLPERDDSERKIPLVPPFAKGEALQPERVLTGGHSPLKKGRRRGFASMTDTMKAVWIGGAFALLAAIIAGAFALFAAPNITITGSECSVVNTGEVSGQTNQDCSQGGSNETK